MIYTLSKWGFFILIIILCPVYLRQSLPQLLMSYIAVFLSFDVILVKKKEIGIFLKNVILVIL